LYFALNNQVSGGVGISVSSPKWSNDGKLLFISDKSNWWNLYRLEDDGTETNLCPVEKELGIPHWVFGMNAYACDPRPGSQDIFITYGEV
jgi:Tol biopolymer transport system component